MSLPACPLSDVGHSPILGAGEKGSCQGSFQRQPFPTLPPRNVTLSAGTSLYKAPVPFPSGHPTPQPQAW